MILLRLTIAIVCTAVGLAGLVLPVLPGWIFLAVAAFLLFPNASFTRNAAGRLDHHAPSVARLLRFLTGTQAPPVMHTSSGSPEPDPPRPHD